MTIDPKDTETLDLEAYAFGSRFHGIPFATRIPLQYVRSDWLREDDVHILLANDPKRHACGRLAVAGDGKLTFNGIKVSHKVYAFAVIYPAPLDATKWPSGDAVDEAVDPPSGHGFDQNRDDQVDYTAPVH
jgi:hypothetical protein